MDDEFNLQSADFWDPGFEGGRFVVVSKVWPFIRIAPRPTEFQRRFWHSVHELGIRDWAIALEPLNLSELCVIEAKLRIRYQPTLRYVREHLEFLPNLHSQIENSLELLVGDIAEQEIRRMETDSSWLKDGCVPFEKAVEDILNGVLVMRGIHCRSRCHIEARFASLVHVNLAELPPEPRHQAVYEEYLRRRREYKEKTIRDETEEEANQRRLLMERETVRLELEKQEEALRNAARAQELENLQAQFAAEEARLAEQQATEFRRRDENVRHNAKLQQMQAGLERKKSESELQLQRERLADETLKLAERQQSEIRQHEDRLRHEIQLGEMQANAESKKQELQLLSESNRLEKELANERLAHERRIQHDASLRQMLEEAETLARENDIEKQRSKIEAEESIKLDNMRAEIERLEEQLRLQRESTARQHEEQLRHEAHLRQLQTEQELQAKEQRSHALVELDNYLTQELSLLATERERLLLEEEIREMKISRTHNFIANARRRLSLRGSQSEPAAENGEAAN